MPTIEKLYPEYIHLDGGTQPRAKIDQGVCAEYGERMKAGEKFPPIDVYFDGKEYWLADGFHRHQAQMFALPGEAIECNVYQGTLQDAQWHSYGVNKAHGLRRTNEDKERAIRAALTHPKSSELSDAAIAEHVGVRRETVLKYRHELAGDLLETNKSNDQPGTAPSSKSALQRSNRRLRTGRDGRTINTAKIGEKQRRKARRPRSPTEYLAAKREGRHVRPRCLIKVELPNNNVHNCAYDLLEHFSFEYLQKVFNAIVQIHQERLEKESTS